MLLRVCCLFVLFFFFFKQKTAYEMRISDWSSDVCSSDLHGGRRGGCVRGKDGRRGEAGRQDGDGQVAHARAPDSREGVNRTPSAPWMRSLAVRGGLTVRDGFRCALPILQAGCAS